MKGEASRAYARVYPQNIHWNVTTEMTIKLWKSRLRPLFRRERPP